jgi:hypothetical protein
MSIFAMNVLSLAIAGVRNVSFARCALQSHVLVAIAFSRCIGIVDILLTAYWPPHERSWIEAEILWLAGLRVTDCRI